MKNLKVGKKLFLSFGIILALYVISIIVAATSIVQNANALDTFYDQPFKVVDTTWEMQKSTENILKNIFWIVTSNDPAVVNQCKSNIDSEIATINADISILQEKFKGDEQLLKDYISITDTAITHQEDIMELALQLTDEANIKALTLMEEQYLPEMDNANAKLQAMSEFAHSNAVKYNDDGTRIKILSLAFLSILAIISLLTGIFLGIKVSKGITEPLTELEKASFALSKGDLSTEIAYQSRDELGSLATTVQETIVALRTIIGDVNYLLGEMGNGNFNIYTKAEESYTGEFFKILAAMRQINANLTDTITQINMTSAQVAAGSDQVSSAAQALSQGATEQASAVEELAATISEISEQVKITAANAEEAHVQTNITDQEVDICNQQMQELTQAMEEINENSQQIDKIIKTIEDIAFQTNILALNAAVEAARAGTAGKGFAVVADEVRNLASKSAEASRNTATLIASAVRSITKGMLITDETATSLSKVVTASKSAGAMVDKITEATREQAESIVQVTQGVDQISGVVQTNSATAEESAAASEELSSQAQILNDLVGHFQLRNNN